MKKLDQASVKKLIKRVVDAWNLGDLDAVCAFYAQNASLILSEEYVQWRESILRRYRDRYPNPDLMGVLSLELLEFQLEVPSAVLRWKIRRQDGSEQSGFSLVTFNEMGQILQDCSA